MRFCAPLIGSKGPAKHGARSSGVGDTRRIKQIREARHFDRIRSKILATRLMLPPLLIPIPNSEVSRKLLEECFVGSFELNEMR